MYMQDKSMIEAVRSGKNISLAIRMDAGSADNADYVTFIFPESRRQVLMLMMVLKNLIQTLNFDAFLQVCKRSRKYN